MKMFRVSVTLLALILPFQAAGDDLPQAAKMASKAVPCPSRDFTTFVGVFSADIAVQIAFTNSPLIVEHVEDAEPEPKTVKRILQQAEIAFPVISSAQARERAGLLPSINKISYTEVQWKLAKPDTDYQIVYHFKKQGCWRLERVSNASL